MSTLGQFATPTGFQQVLEGTFDCACDEIRFLEAEIEKASKQAEMNEGKAVHGCKCTRCQDVRYLHPFLAEVPLTPGIPSWRIGAGA